MKNLKTKSGKPRQSILVEKFVDEMVGVMQHGADKYDDWNWLEGNSWSCYVDAMRRHIRAWNGDAEVNAEDSKRHHLAHVACNAMILYVYEMHKLGVDDRPGATAERLIEQMRRDTAKVAASDSEPFSVEVQLNDKSWDWIK